MMTREEWSRRPLAERKIAAQAWCNGWRDALEAWPASQFYTIDSPNVIDHFALDLPDAPAVGQAPHPQGEGMTREVIDDLREIVMTAYVQGWSTTSTNDSGKLSAADTLVPRILALLDLPDAPAVGRDEHNHEERLLAAWIRYRDAVEPEIALSIAHKHLAAVAAAQGGSNE